MSASKRLLATLVGFVVYFLLGWLIYGVGLTDFYESHSTEAGLATMRPDDGMIWWALIVANIFMAYFLVYIFGKWASISTFGGGLNAGLMLGLIMGVAMNLMWYATADVMDMTAAIVDVFVTGVMWAITGGAIGWMLGRN